MNVLSVEVVVNTNPRVLRGAFWGRQVSFACAPMDEPQRSGEHLQEFAKVSEAPNSPTIAAESMPFCQCHACYAAVHACIHLPGGQAFHFEMGGGTKWFVRVFRAIRLQTLGGIALTPY